MKVELLLPSQLGVNPLVGECPLRRTGGQPSLPYDLVVARRPYTVWGNHIQILVAIGVLETGD